ncbi:L,D-transpeptidase [Oscillatoria sp. FACHB-1407]|uniref:L,D-transpeptidase n=1 Tax=Oscillatoria sp. FACHB-1407 TaxID=2692847 RepID=UPI001684C9B7|nr:L,D-transpeptidase [Oscillatoria sp. FACHB-1407]MBD2460844.1 L,D-transpeptidase [Oscillatoria sp. FACHB-1407]
MGTRIQAIALTSSFLAIGLLTSPTPLPANEVIPYYEYSHGLATNQNGTIVDLGDSPTHLEIDLSDRRLTLYQGETQLKSYPVAVGRRGWRTPIGNFEVMQKIQDPTWVNPLTGQVVAGGSANNPLGRYWIGFWTDGYNWVGMHGTPNPESVGRAVSHGCVRLYNHDIQELFAIVEVGTPVRVVP